MNLLNTNLTLDYINNIFRTTNRLIDPNNDNSAFLKGFILCNCFFEPSTRTSLSFNSAMLRMGGSVMALDKSTSSIQKGESDYDTLKTIEQYCDIIVVRHPSKEFIFNYASKCSKPIINGGNGDGEHPTQALLDLYIIKKYFPEKSIKILFVGDIKHSRTIHSLENLLSLYHDVDIDYFPYPTCEKESKNNISNYDNMNKYDVVYMTRLQVERFESNNNPNFNMNNYILNKDIADRMREDAIILHPLPRNNELDISVDDCKQAKYLDEQMKYGVYVRMAILYHHLKCI